MIYVGFTENELRLAIESVQNDMDGRGCQPGGCDEFKLGKLEFLSERLQAHLPEANKKDPEAPF